MKKIVLEYPGRLFIDDEQISPARSLGLRNHSPDGFAWGYGGSGPSQTALAILLELTSKQFATANYQDFKWAFIASAPGGESVILPGDKVEGWLKDRGWEV